MTIDEAIKRLEGDIEGNYYQKGSNLGKAMKLGIEALKRVKVVRDTPSWLSCAPLPGETEE